MRKLQCGKITNKSIEQLKHLTYLDLGYNNYITDDGIKCLKSLTYLDTSYNHNITDGGLKDLKLTTFIHVNYTSGVTDKSITLMAATLRSLTITDQHDITDDSIRKLTNLQVLSIKYCNMITDDSLKLLTNLTSLSVCWNKTITDQTLIHLKLKELKVDHNNFITDDGIMHMDLHVLTAIRCGITDKSVKLMKNLYYLDASINYDITDNGICNLPLKQLRFFGNPNITYRTIEQLKLQQCEPSIKDNTDKFRECLFNITIVSLVLIILNIAIN